MLRVLTLSTLFPDETRPNFGPFVALQTQGLAAHPDVELRVIAPVGIPPFGQFHPHYKALAALPDVEAWNGLPVYRTPFVHVPGVGGRFDPKALARALAGPLAEIRKAFPFDVVDAEFFFPDGPAAIDLGRALGVPVSIKARGADIHFWGTSNRATRHQVIAAGQAAEGMLAVSAALKADMVALGMPEERITVHYTGIDRSRFYVRDRAQTKAALGIAGPLLVSVGNLIERKGHSVVIDALLQVPEATLVIIGAGEARSRFAAQVSRSNLQTRVRLLGSQPHEIIADWLAAADAMVLMSQSEGLANAWVEALASGTPIVISDVGGAREVLDRPEAGILARPDPMSIADAVRTVLARDANRLAVAATVDRFSWDTNAAALYAHLSALKARGVRR
jgi:teichuronic acid biosynthesis glycosyltransferase TuaC